MGTPYTDLPKPATSAKGDRHGQADPCRSNSRTATKTQAGAPDERLDRADDRAPPRSPATMPHAISAMNAPAGSRVQIPNGLGPVTPEGW